MTDLVVELRQVGDSATSEGIARQHRVLIDRPEAKGGLDQGPMGGELLLIALGGCFMSNLIAAAPARNVRVDGMSVSVAASWERRLRGSRRSSSACTGAGPTTTRSTS